MSSPDPRSRSTVCGVMRYVYTVTAKRSGRIGDRQQAKRRGGNATNSRNTSSPLEEHAQRQALCSDRCIRPYSTGMKRNSRRETSVRAARVVDMTVAVLDTTTTTSGATLALPIHRVSVEEGFEMMYTYLRISLLSS